ncbi:MAG: 4Fe-4S binding protein [Deltaproteobacteria bacterium]|jgi:NAD-dependent dihydropyrimidine dehydrogenase PreA subunit|nr:4Fe-4S binding protein [Deltaproteobacteria bacterium]
MGAKVFEELCRGCGNCLTVCPGDLVGMATGEGAKTKFARILEPERCWGCGACLKACPYRAIGLGLHPALGGRGLVLTVLGEDDKGRVFLGKSGGDLPKRLRWQVKGEGFFEEIVTEPGRRRGY